MSCNKKQQLLFEYIKENKFNIINLQEHNLKKREELLEIVNEYFYVFISETINLKGGTAILVDRRITDNIISVEKSLDARIISVKLMIGTQNIHILNIYSPSGSKYHHERENLFRDDILYYLRNNLSNTIICGDFNCITHVRDKTKNGNCPISKSLKITINNLKLQDIWNLHHQHVQYTYFRKNYASRLDRIYAGDFKESFINITVKPMTLSDHHIVIADLNVSTSIKVGRFYWELNTKLLDLVNIENEFKATWVYLCRSKNKYKNINEWWELCAKEGIQRFFKSKGKEESKMRQGLIKYLECKLNCLYKDIHSTGNIDMHEANRLKNKINNIK